VLLRGLAFAEVAFSVGCFGIAGHGVTYAAAMDGGVAKCSRIVLKQFRTTMQEDETM
jgi:hypothetical protein